MRATATGGAPPSTLGARALTQARDAARGGTLQ